MRRHSAALERRQTPRTRVLGESYTPFLGKETTTAQNTGATSAYDGQKVVVEAEGAVSHGDRWKPVQALAQCQAPTTWVVLLGSCWGTKSHSTVYGIGPGNGGQTARFWAIKPRGVP